MTTTAWLVVGDGPGTGALVDLARSLAHEVVAVVVGEAATAQAVAQVVDRVDWVPCLAQVPAEAYAAAVRPSPWRRTPRTTKNEWMNCTPSSIGRTRPKPARAPSARLR